MGYVDVSLFLLSLAIVVVGQTFWTVQSKKRRAAEAVAHKNQYFSKLQQDCQTMTFEVNKNIEELESENNRIKAKLKELGVSTGSHAGGESVADLERVKSGLEQKKHQLTLIDEELTEIRSRVGLEDTLMPEDLSKKIVQLQSENKTLESQLKTHDELVLPTRNATMDTSIVEFLKQDGNKYSLEQLDALYEKLLEEKVADPNRSLDAYESRIKSFDYEAEHQRLDVERKRVEKIYERERRLYMEDAEAFNETRIEFCFKIPAVMGVCNALKELNNIEERTLRNCHKDTNSKPSGFDKSWKYDQEDHYP